MREEFFVFLAALVGGALLGVLFDFFRAFRTKVKSGVHLTALQDVLFWLIAAGSVFTFVFYINGAQMRYYIFAALILGALIYNATISRAVIKLILFLAKFVLLAICFLAKPFIKLAFLIKKPVFVVIMPYKRLKAKFRTQISKIKKILKLY